MAWWQLLVLANWWQQFCFLFGYQFDVAAKEAVYIQEVSKKLMISALLLIHSDERQLAFHQAGSRLYTRV